jgi:hypothetical protein
MKAKKLLLKQLLMDMAGKAKAGLQGPADLLSWARLDAYQEKLEPARGVSWVRLGAYLGKILKFYRDEIIKSYHATVIFSNRDIIISLYDASRIVVQAYYISWPYMTDKLSLCYKMLQKLACRIVI